MIGLPNPRETRLCSACIGKRLHTPSEWGWNHPLAGHGYTPETGWTHPGLAPKAEVKNG